MDSLPTPIGSLYNIDMYGKIKSYPTNVYNYNVSGKIKRSKLTLFGDTDSFDNLRQGLANFFYKGPESKLF